MSMTVNVITLNSLVSSSTLCVREWFGLFHLVCIHAWVPNCLYLIIRSSWPQSYFFDFACGTCIFLHLDSFFWYECMHTPCFTCTRNSASNSSRQHALHDLRVHGLQLYRRPTAVEYLDRSLLAHVGSWLNQSSYGPTSFILYHILYFFFLQLESESVIYSIGYLFLHLVFASRDFGQSDESILSVSFAPLQTH